MKNTLSTLSRNQSLLYKGFLFIAATFLILYLFPKAGQFKYDFQKGKPWQYENLYAPFSFTIKKAPESLASEKEQIVNNAVPYFNMDMAIVTGVTKEFYRLLDEAYQNSFFRVPKLSIQSKGAAIIDQIYKHGVLNELYSYDPDKLVYLKSGNEIDEVTFHQIVSFDTIDSLIKTATSLETISPSIDLLEKILTIVIKPNVSLNTKLTQTAIDDEVNAVNPNKGIVEKSGRIIAKGELVDTDAYQILDSLKAEYQSQVWTKSNYLWLLVGYGLLVMLVLLMLLLFLNKYRPEIYNNNTKVTFIFFNVLLMVLLTTIVVKMDAKYVYVVPLCILPLILKAFFDPRLGLFVHVLTVLLLGFIVPNSFEYLFLQIIAGIVTILTVSELYKRANLFISVTQITFIYIIGYFAFVLIQEGNIYEFEWVIFGYFVLCGLATLFAHPLIYFYEKLFGLVSDVSLLELSDTNSKLLKELSNKAPGTFHHSLNVANLAEAAAQEIGANSMLVRVGALYHDIGKMASPAFFTENQLSGVNSHDELEPQESASIIINHVIDGIEIARKNNLPDRIIDFIRTHHGTSMVYYFYKKELETQGQANKEDFKYPGPIPFSKETAILMMADSVEAASKSLKDPTSTKIDIFVEKIIDAQMDQGQFLNADVTFKDIELIKKMFKKKLNNMFHLRVEYPE
jgi:hypothetical protein